MLGYPRPPSPNPIRWLAPLLLLSLALVACTGSSDSGDSGSDASDDGGLTFESLDGGGEAEATPPSTDGDPAPDIAFEYFDGEPGTLDDLIGTPIVVNFWASWCAPCVAEMPDLEEVFQEFGEDVQFLGFNVTDQRDDADELIERTGVTYPMASDPAGEIHRAFRGFAMPTTILIAADGTVARSHAGAISGDQLRRFIAEDFGP